MLAIRAKGVTPRLGTRISDLAARQYGVLSRAQLEDLGLERNRIARYVEDGRLHRLHRGVYAVGHTVLKAEGRWLAAVLASGPGAALSHGSAAALWDLRSAAAATTHVTVPRAGGRRVV